VTDEARRLTRAAELGLDLQNVEFLRAATLCDAFRFAGATLSPRYGSAEPVDFNHVPLDSIVASYLPNFYAERDQLLAYARMARSL
jgi:hypothetical protein